MGRKVAPGTPLAPLGLPHRPIRARGRGLARTGGPKVRRYRGPVPEPTAPTAPRGRDPRQGVAVLGATGSVGGAALDVLEQERARFRPVVLVAATQGDALLAAARRVGAPRIVLADPVVGAAWAERLGPDDPELAFGPEAVRAAAEAPDVDVVVQGITGAAGLEASLAAARSGKRIALANKESLVVAGPLLVRAAREGGATLLPVDSEHAALHQALRAGRPDEVRRLVLTASGGPFRGKKREDLLHVTPAEALAHPTWTMGPRITVDSATLMNKALEVIEARWLFDVEPERIEVVVHPQSIVHSLVEFVDGSVVAQMGPPDMRLPVRYALGWPDRLEAAAPRFDAADYARLTFEPPDTETFPALGLGFEAARRGGTAGAALNAADETAVARFLAGELAFLDITRVVADVLARHPFVAEPDLADLRAVDAWARTETALACEAVS
ncbi:MAG: 1-deoxy-D-xylulose-5-phosphate reductoisomerase [Planctomycetes bacterium]|nr:1-deoxy-D-xylulose-5-phosphate reductoisomerase [Planctomycetota bacterium]